MGGLTRELFDEEHDLKNTNSQSRDNTRQDSSSQGNKKALKWKGTRTTRMKSTERCLNIPDHTLS